MVTRDAEAAPSLQDLACFRVKREIQTTGLLCLGTRSIAHPGFAWQTDGMMNQLQLHSTSNACKPNSSETGQANPFSSTQSVDTSTITEPTSLAIEHN